MANLRICRLFLFFLFLISFESAFAGIPTIRYHVHYQKGYGYVDQDVPSRQVACDMFGADMGFTNARVEPGWDVPNRWGGYPSTNINCLYSSPFSLNDERSPGGAYCGPSYFQGNSFTVDKTTETCGCAPPSRYMPDADVCVALDTVSSPPPNNPKNNGANCPQCGQPINPVNGNMWHREADYIGPASQDLQVTRFYNSSLLDWGANDKHLFGSHWTTWLDMSLRPEIANATLAAKCWKRRDNGLIFCDPPPLPATGLSIPDAVSILRPDGKRFYFNRKDMTFVNDADISERLSPIFDSSNQSVVAWNLLTPNASTEMYSSDGHLLSITRRTGESVSLTYSDGTTNDTGVGRWPASAPVCTNVFSGDIAPSGRLLCATDSYGRQLNFEYNANGVISKIIDPDGRTLQYEYDGSTSNGCTSGADSWWCHLNNLTRVTYQDGNSHTYYYNEASRINKGASCSGAASLFPGFAHLPTAMTGLVDENGDRYISWDYTCDGFADISELNGGVEKVSIDYGYVRSGMLSPNVSHFTGTADAPTISSQYYGYELIIGAAKNNSFGDTCYECGIYKRSFHDANGNLSYAIDWNGNYHCFAYDMGRNLETARVEVSTSSSCPTLLSATSLVFPMRRISTDWDPRFRLPVRVAEPKKITSYSYDNQGNLLAMSVQATTDITGASGFAATSAGNPRTWSYTYNASGKILSRKGPRADVNDVMSYEYDSAGNLAASINALGHRTEYSGYDASGRVGKVREPNGTVTEYKYSPRGWLVSSTTTADAVVSQTDYQYDNVGLLTRVTNPDKSYLSYQYDKAHRLIRIDDNLNNSVIYTLDLLGNRIGEQVTDPNGILVRQIKRVFDSLNNPVKVVGSAQ